MRIDTEVLILTGELDFSTDRICKELKNRNIQFLRLNREQLSEFTFILDPKAPRMVCCYEDVEWTVDNSLNSVWWRQGTFDRNVAGGGYTIQEQLVRSQWAAFMRSMMVFDGARWINHPAAVYKAETKAVQLLEARRVGFNVPNTYCTNDQNFNIENLGADDVALKSIDTLLLRDGSDQLFGYTSLVKWSDVANSEFRQAPATVQQALRDKLDLRVTVIGEQLWCVKIEDSGKSIQGDWRLTPKKDLNYTDYVLPCNVANQCKELVRRLGLRYGGIDLAIDQGEFWFIEINPTGEWGWLDEPSRPIAQAIAGELLCGL